MARGVETVRSAAFAAWFYAVTLLFCLAGIPIRLFAPYLALPLARHWARTVLAGLPPICNIHVRLSGLERLPRHGPALLAGQHQSEFDTLVWMAVLERPCYVMKQELTRIPLFGPLLVPAGMIPVDRSGGATAMRALLGATAQAAARQRQIVIFPEGTRVPHGEMVPLQPGVAAVAARTAQPTFPVATDSGRCWPRSALGKRAGTIHIAIGPPIAQPCRRDTMLAAIEDYWRSMADTGFASVDNSVEASLREACAGGAKTR